MTGTVICIALALLAVSGVVVWRQQHLMVLSVQSASMAPMLQPGDAVVVRQVAASQLKVGDIVSYSRLSTDGKSIRVTHRIVAIDSSTGRLVTQGDDNATADLSISSSQVTGRAERRFANAGYTVDFLRSPKGLAVLIYAPALTLVVIELRRLTRYFKPVYRHYSWQ
jgi:signal peptidase